MNLRAKKHEYIARPEEVRQIVDKFSHALIAELGQLVKSVVWFGSAQRGDFVDGTKSIRDEALFGSDIDVLIVLDDQIHLLTAEVITAYRVITEKTAARISKRLHITTMPITKFWDYSLKGDPILINMLREGTPVFDSGTFSMAKQMLNSKKIRPGKEVVWIYLARGPQSIANSQWNMGQAVLDLHWAVIDAAHSALLHFDIVPDSPEFTLELMKLHLVNRGVLDKKYLALVAEFINVGKMLMSRELNKMSGNHYDRYRKEADDFIHAVKRIITSG